MPTLSSPLVAGVLDELSFADAIDGAAVALSPASISSANSGPTVYDDDAPLHRESGIGLQASALFSIQALLANALADGQVGFGGGACPDQGDEHEEQQATHEVFSFSRGARAMPIE
jgi:hypothetical protein